MLQGFSLLAVVMCVILLTYPVSTFAAGRAGPQDLVAASTRQLRLYRDDSSCVRIGGDDTYVPLTFISNTQDECPTQVGSLLDTVTLICAGDFPVPACCSIGGMCNSRSDGEGGICEWSTGSVAACCAA